MSITAFNLRLTSMTSKRWRACNWVFFGICGAYTVVAFFLNIFQCNPAGASFDLLLVAERGTNPKCEGVAEMGTILRTINFVLDWCLVLIPIAVLWRVQMSPIKKARLLAAMTVGSLACIASVLTLVAKERLKSDPLWNYTAILGWSVAEITIGAVAASLPTLAFLLPLPSPRSRNGGSGRRGGSRNTGQVELATSSADGVARSNNGSRAADEARSVTMTTSSSRERLADDECATGIVRTIEIEIELESKKRASSDVDSQEHAVATYQLGHLRDGRGHT